MINAEREIGYGKEIETGEEQQNSAGEAADEARGSAGGEAADSVLGTAQRFFGWAPALSEIDVATPPRVAVPGTAILFLF